MPRFKDSVRVPYRPEDCFELVSGIAQYPEFIRWITSMRVEDRRETAPGIWESLGHATVGFKGFVDRFSTRVVADAPAGKVTATLVKGPFRRLMAEWRIVQKVAGHSDITLDIDYEFRNPILGFFAKANQDLAAERILAAFLNEAQRRYAPGPLSPRADAGAPTPPLSSED